LAGRRAPELTHRSTRPRAAATFGHLLRGRAIRLAILAALGLLVLPASAGAYSCWTNPAGTRTNPVGTIGRANPDGSGLDPNFITTTKPRAVAVDGAYVYWTGPDYGPARSAAPTSTAPA
jgi:hypothetical protein